MKRKFKIYLLAILTSSGFWMRSNAQVPPNLDPNWIIDTLKSDEFNSTSFNSSKWDKGYSGCGWGWGYGSYLSTSNVIMDNGFLRLRWQKSGSSMSVGQIRSKNSNYSFGYFEISAKILDPGNFKNGIPCATGLWPSFWTYYTGDLPCYHDEIDIVETLYNACEDVNIMSGGVWDKVPESTDPNASNCPGVKTFSKEHRHSQPLFEGEHRYAAEWLSDRVILYFDNQPVGIYYGNGIPQYTQYVVLYMQTNTSWVDFDETITSPQDMKVNYFRYYKLIDDYCGTDASIQNNTQLNSFVFGVRRNITIGTGSSSISLSSGDNKTFRATNEITLNGDFTVPLGAELNLIPTPCN